MGTHLNYLGINESSVEGNEAIDIDLDPMIFNDLQ
jgi:hypothetical protein